MNKIKKTNMKLLLYPWILIWIMMGISPKYAGILGILSSISALLFFHKKFKLTIYDKLSAILVASLGVLLLLGINFMLVMLSSYCLFGLMWSLSCLRAKPLSAYYSGSSVELDKNPIFLKTNKIITLSWGILYLITPIWTYYLSDFHTSTVYTVAINSIVPLLMTKFTDWFKVWYPKNVVRVN